MDINIYFQDSFILRRYNFEPQMWLLEGDSFVQSLAASV